MESRVLVVSLFAPYSVNFDAAQKTPQDIAAGAPTDNAASVHDKKLGRSGSTSRNSIWNGRRSSVHRTHTTPLGHHGQPHSRRRSTFSIKLAPVSRTSSDSSDLTSPMSPTDKHESSLATCAEGDTDEGTAAPTNTHLSKAGPSQLAFTIDEALGAHTPPANTLDFTRKMNLDLMREKQARSTGAGKHGRLLRGHTLPQSEDHKEKGPFSGAKAAGWFKDLSIAGDINEEQKHEALEGSVGKLHIDPRGERRTPSTISDAIGSVSGTDDQFMVEHLNVGNIGLFNAINANLDLFAERVWIGELGIPTDEWSEERKTAVSNKLLDEFETLPVFVSDKEFEGHYGRFSKQLIWPAFHYIMPEMPQWHGWERSAYEAALSTCHKFADRIAEIYRDGDIIWVNDYHLMLLPKLIRERLPNAKIGFFLHIPFPSSEIFRCLHVRKELLEGMLGADVVGLQTFAYKRHLIHTAKHVLGVEGSPSGLTTDRGHVVIGQYAMGLDPIGVEEKWSNVSVGELIEFLREKYAGNYLLVGRDKLDHVKGVRQKMLGYECFLNENPEFASKTVFIQIALTTAEHNELQVQVMDVVNRINSKFGTIEHQPVVFFHKDIPYSHYLALLSTADAMVITSLRDGMNLTSHEYVLCQREKNSPLILSEFVGTYGAFSGGALGVNPMDTNAIAQAIKDALIMSTEEKYDRWNILHQQVLTNSAASFVSSFITDIKAARPDSEGF
ncbi:Trehalose-6-P synthase/phosphatase complex subunit [Coemansia spiralis]|uniref:Trehalose-6-P synthase/phosphatase complex subunit n=2 Tax=Coemansia TaxID=4863 RepID=A0A9W8L056_9FUNG|nr:Trehalose-6-P synthase/phosphatase complex subunit [Coemansia umbellata]KAJ2624021.1 Trehalose-6-P synthase/phosphatase complex subunit [Coemansia sp. RSA 1358]KAJ2679630.1 Trehalose-6-P synthase/phosphatase complex subunit [Coemansia spiralis]